MIRPVEGSALLEAVAENVDRLTTETFRLVRGQQALFAFLDSLSKVLLTCLPEPFGDAIDPAVAKGRLRYDRLLKAAGRAMSGDAKAALQDLMARDGTEELCTRQLGFRTTLDAEYAQARETEQQHVTSLDRMIAKQAVEPSDDPDRFLFRLPELTAHNRTTVQSLAVRANVLCRMGLAEPVDARTWSVRRDFESVLRAMKRGRDRQKTLRDHGAAISDDRLPFVTVDPRRMKMIQGRVLVHGEDEAGRAYLLIEGTDAQVHHVPYVLAIQRCA